MIRRNFFDQFFKGIFISKQNKSIEGVLSEKNTTYVKIVKIFAVTLEYTFE